METIKLTQCQSIELMMLDFTTINFRALHKAGRFDNRLEAQKCLKPGQLLAENNVSVFILEPKHY